MCLAFIYSLVSRKTLPIYFFRLNLFFISSLFIYGPNSHCQSLSAEQIYNKVSDAVVVIHAYDDNDELATQGSGVVFNDKGYVVTNYHVFAGNRRIEILHGEEVIPNVEIAGIDVDKDILILKIKANQFLPIKIGDSKSLKIGQRIYAIGSPMGFENSISEGIISGLRNYDELNRNFIQITASISHGSSGGAVVNDKGELIGISTLTLKEGQNLNFAIPINDILKVQVGSYSKEDSYKDFELFKYGRNAIAKGNYQESITFFTRYIKNNPNSANAFYNRGFAKKELKDYLGALEDYNKSILNQPNDGDSYLMRGNVKKILKDYEGALTDYNKVIELDPNNATAFYNCGGVKWELEDYRGALKEFNQAIDLNPNYSTAYYNRGGVENKLEDYESAINDYNKAIKYNPSYADAYLMRGLVKSKINNYGGAIRDYNKKIDLDPNDYIAYYNRGIVEFDLGDYDNAAKDLSTAIKFNPNDADSYYMRGLVKRKLNDLEGAIRDYNKTIELNPNDANAYLNRGTARYIANDKVGACFDWRKAKELGSEKAYQNIKDYCK